MTTSSSDNVPARVPIRLPDGTTHPLAIVCPTRAAIRNDKLDALHTREHPSDGTMIVQLFAGETHQAVIVNGRGAILFEPNDTVDIVFDGADALFLVKSVFAHGPSAHGIVVTALQSEFTWYVERVAWPSLDVLAACDVDLPQGWPTGLVLDRARARLIVQWNDQCEAGYVVVDAKDGLRVEPEWELFEQNEMASTAVVSPNGSRIALPFAHSWDWWASSGIESGRAPVAPVPKGMTRYGYVLVHEIETGDLWQVDINVELPPSYVPPTSGDWSGRFADLVWTSENAFRIRIGDVVAAASIPHA